MKEPHNYAHVGYGMIAVAASLAAIGIIALFIGDNGLLADNMQRENTHHFNECKSISLFHFFALQTLISLSNIFSSQPNPVAKGVPFDQFFTIPVLAHG